MRDLTTLTRGALLLSALVLGACEEDDSNNNSTATGSATGVAGSTSTPANTAGAAGGGMQRVDLNDAQIASIAVAANTGEVDQNTVAVTRAVNPDVRGFAQDMVAMHTAAVMRESALAATEMIVPADNHITQTLQTMSTTIVANLQAAEASEFDLMFMNGQVDVHTEVLALIRDQLLPEVTSVALRSELMEMQTTVMTHLERARTLRTAVGGARSMP
jgi:putative membrane protein